MSTLAKPVLRGHCYRHAVKTMIAAGLLAVTTSSMYYFFVAVPKKNSYHEFLRTYDEKEHMKELLKYDLLPTYKRLLKEKQDKM